MKASGHKADEEKSEKYRYGYSVLRGKYMALRLEPVILRTILNVPDMVRRKNGKPCKIKASQTKK